MIKGNKKKPLLTDTVLQVLSPYDIFYHYMPNRDWKVNQLTFSPFRDEKDGSFLISNVSGRLGFFDYGDSTHHGDCFDFVQQLYNIPSLDETLKMIDRDFGLGISSSENIGKYKQIKSEYKQPEEEIGKRYSVIQVVTRPFTNEELKYWEGYGQTIEDLKKHNVYSVRSAFLNRRKYTIKDDELRFGYLINDRWKLYFPNRSKARKWISNVPLTTMGGLENLNKEHNTLICKALKDMLCCLKIYPHICYVQNESVAAFSEENVKYINENSKNVFYGGDSDSSGKAASYTITKLFGWKHINPPDFLIDDCCKDFSDWFRRDKNEVKEHFIKKGLLE